MDTNRGFQVGAFPRLALLLVLILALGGCGSPAGRAFDGQGAAAVAILMLVCAVSIGALG